MLNNKLLLKKPITYFSDKLIKNSNRKLLSNKGNNLNNNIFKINRYLLIMGIGISFVTAYITSATRTKILETQLTKNKFKMLDGQLNIRSEDEDEDNLRIKFNFIDKVAKQCMDAVVFIEILDPKKVDPLTNEPIILSNGSGFVFREDGWILTNAHVVINKPQAIIFVKFPDGTSYKATVEDADMNIDLALLKINSNRIFPALNFGSSNDVCVGEWVLALGSPLSLSHSVTAGVVSSATRDAEELGLKNRAMRYIQTDASITFGNSGGPLVNLDGNVIGINNLRITSGISFAIPIDYAKKFIERSTLHLKKVTNSDNETHHDKFLGIATITLSKTIIDEILSDKEIKFKNLRQGVLVYTVINGTVADKSGLLVGDIVTHINQHPILSATDIYSTYNSLNGDKLVVDVIRKGQNRKIVLKT